MLFPKSVTELWQQQGGQGQHTANRQRSLDFVRYLPGNRIQTLCLTEQDLDLPQQLATRRSQMQPLCMTPDKKRDSEFLLKLRDGV